MIVIKPHHFIDILSDLGRGVTEYAPHPYGHAVHSVTAELLRERDVVLRMEMGADDICAPCVHNISGLCDDTIDTSYRPTAPKSKRESNLLIDGRWCARLGIRQGDEMTARRFCELVREKAGDITDIYREIPAEMTAKRQAALMKGVEAYLARAEG